MSKERIIFHIDVNNAYLSWTAVKLLKEGYPIDIRTIPSVIGGDESKRHGIVLAKSPIAKKFGIVTAETLYSARKKCPNLRVFPPDHTLYLNMSKALFQYLNNYSPDIEQFSVDECFIDMSNTTYLYKDLVSLAYKIKEEIKLKFGFTVNIGIGNNKLCAKMASDFEKPDKVHTLFKNEIKEKMWPLPVNELFMVGKKSSARLKEMGIMKIGDLATTDVTTLRRHFKSFSKVMWEFANGIDEEPVVKEHGASKSISVSATLPKDTDDILKLKNILLGQADEVGIQLRKQKMYASVIAVTLKTKDFLSYSKQNKLKNPIDISTEIYKHAVIILDSVWNGEEIRNIGIRLSNLKEVREEQISLFDKPNIKQSDKIQKTLDEIKEKYGSSSIVPASLIKKNNT